MGQCLSVIEAEGSDDQLAMLYTSLYHTMINPSVYCDVDGLYRGVDGNIHHAEGFTNYTIFSTWDTFRACTRSTTSSRDSAAMTSSSQ